jgi:phage tail sheath protein FI
MAVSTFKHGVTWRDVPTSIVGPITSDIIPVAVGAAPIHLADDPAPLNVPRVYYTYEEAVNEMGYSDDWVSYPLCEVMYTFFVLHNTGPIVLINVFDPADNMSAPVAPADMSVTNKQVVIAEPNVVLSSIVVKDAAGAITYVANTDYSAAYNNDGHPVVSILPSPGTIPPTVTTLKIGYTKTNPSAITKADIIGGIDVTTDKGTGLEAIEEVFPVHSIVPGILITPGYSQEPEVAAVLAAKCDNINGCFRCISYVDADSETVIRAQDVNDWKNDNNYVSNRLAVMWPRVGLDEKQFWLSTQVAALTQWVDHSNTEIPYESPSNKHLKINKTVAGPIGTPVDLFFSKASADSLNGQGIVTSINWLSGWKCWGNRMSAYPSTSDVKDVWIPVRRMTDFIGNSIVLTVFQFVDKPGNRRLIDSIIDSLNIWLNSLVAAGYLLGARVEFRHDENPTTELLSGHYKFHVYQASPIPAEWIEFLIEFDVNYLQTLFTPVSTQTPAVA